MFKIKKYDLIVADNNFAPICMCYCEYEDIIYIDGDYLTEGCIIRVIIVLNKHK